MQEPDTCSAPAKCQLGCVFMNFHHLALEAEEVNGCLSFWSAGRDSLSFHLAPMFILLESGWLSWCITVNNNDTYSVPGPPPCPSLHYPTFSSQQPILQMRKLRHTEIK